MLNVEVKKIVATLCLLLTNFCARPPRRHINHAGLRISALWGNLQAGFSSTENVHVLLLALLQLMARCCNILSLLSGSRHETCPPLHTVSKKTALCKCNVECFEFCKKKR